MFPNTFFGASRIGARKSCRKLVLRTSNGIVFLVRFSYSLSLERWTGNSYEKVQIFPGFFCQQRIDCTTQDIAYLTTLLVLRACAGRAMKESILRLLWAKTLWSITEYVKSTSFQNQHTSIRKFEAFIIQMETCQDLLGLVKHWYKNAA